MLEFIQHLKQRYQALLEHLDKKNPQYFDYQQAIDQLLYAEAYARKVRLIAESPRFPLQIAVIGPTQAGKSSIVNLLLNGELAGVSPLAGYTVHPQGFCHQINYHDCDELQHYFGRFQCLEQSALSRNRFDCYSLATSQGSSDLLPPCVVWDTPDFDSIDAADYREGVIRTIALADIIVLVVSKEKYADQSVWEVMKTIAAFKQPTLICLNKVNEGSEAVLLESLRQKWQQSRHDAMPMVVNLPFQKLATLPLWPATAKNALVNLSQQVAHKHCAENLHKLLIRQWPQWLAPIVAEHHAQQQWQTLVEQCLADALKLYRRDYLDHPHHYQTFQNALLNLLKLLEIPGFARALSKTRRVMTWPVRKLMAMGQGAANPIQEISILNQIGEHVLIQLADKLLEKAETQSNQGNWWRETALALRQHRPQLLLRYQQAVTLYHDDFRQDVDAAAHRLYYKLQEQPLVLNSLRATRITTDAGAMLLAIQTGGIGIHDLILTPLMLTITSLLTESAIGSYMHKVEAELKQHQLHTVNSSLFETILKQSLQSLPQQLRSPSRFNISEQQLSQAEQALKEKKHGLRIL
jgi:GTPase SAR1 family protein